MKLNRKKTIIIFGVVVLILAGLFLSWQNKEISADYYEVVFIRHLEKDSFDYTATIDYASNLLPGDSVSTRSDNRDLPTIDNLSIAPSAKVFLVGEGMIGLGQFKNKFLAEPEYVNKVFTVGISEGMIVSIKEEEL